MLTTVPKTGHWTDNHIRFDTVTSEFVAFDEAGLEYGRYATRPLAIAGLESYSTLLERENESA